MRQRQRDARRSGRVVTSISSLPAELLGSIVGYACPGYDGHDHETSWLGVVTRIGCVNKSFLESLKYVGELVIDLMDLGANGWGDDDDPFISVAYNHRLRRWCDVASRRLSNVKIARDYCVWHTFGKSFNPTQTQLIVKCLASFDKLERVHFFEAEPLAACISIAASVREGRFGNLKHLILDCRSSRAFIHRPPHHVFIRQQAKIGFEDLISQLPPDLAMDVVLKGAYPSLLAREDNWTSWASTFFGLVARGADVHTRPILCEVMKMHDWPKDDNISYTTPRRDIFFNTIERLLVVHGVDPNVKAPSYYGAVSHSPLWHMLSSVDNIVWQIVPRVDSDDGGVEQPPLEDAEALEPLLSVLMRTVDLLVRHGAVSKWTRPPAFDPDYDEAPEPAAADWILARPDCTSRVRDAANRGELMFGSGRHFGT